MERFAGAIPADLSGKSVLDIGCNGGFYSIQMKRRGAARVLGDRFRSRLSGAGSFRRRGRGLEIDVRAAVGLRCRLAAASGSTSCCSWACSTIFAIRCLRSICIRENVAGDIMVFQSMQRGSGESEPVARGL